MDREINLLERRISSDPQNKSLWLKYLLVLSRIYKENWPICERFLSKWQHTRSTINITDIFPLNTDMRMWGILVDLLFEIDYVEEEVFTILAEKLRQLPNSPEKLLLISRINRTNTSSNWSLADFLDKKEENYLNKTIEHEPLGFDSEEFSDCRFFIVEMPETSHWSDHYKDRVYAVTGTYLIDKEQDRYLFTRMVHFLEPLSGNAYDIYRDFDRDEEADEIVETIEDEWRSAAEGDYMNQSDVRSSAINLYIIDPGEYDPEDYDNDEELRNQVRDDYSANPVF
jgi:hypothetical protein